jgi:sigma-B regulation protein RsbU (phosphoserine phosphatase)
MLNAVHAFVGKAEQSDDLTMLAVKWLPEEDSHGGMGDKAVRHSIVMRNDIQQIPTLAEWVESLHIPDALNMTINLALEEAVTNVMLYAYPGENGKVLIEAEKTPQRITFTISDSGIPFDPTQRPEADITLPAEDRAIGGLGIHLVRQIMDDIHYERKDNRNILTLAKKL